MILSAAMIAAAATDTLAASPFGSLEFARTSSLAWLGLAGIAAIALAAAVAWRRRALARLADAPLLALIAPRIVGARAGLRAALAVLALASIALALGDPRAGERLEKVEQRGIDAMIVVDVSRSMLAEDATPDRLTRAKQFAADLVDALGSDRVGLVEFAGVPALRCPLTFNHRAFLSQLELLSPQSTVRGGSMLGDAIRLAASSLSDEGAGKAIIVLSDGEDMESEPVEAAATAAKEHGIRTISVGIGDKSEGARIPVSDGSGRKRFLVHEGQEVWTKMDPSLLTKVAEAGEGFFVEAGTSQADMRQVAAFLSTKLEKRELERADVTTKDPLYQWLAALALAALVADAFVRPRRLGTPQERPTAAGSVS
jgi:Ca-activated chloride channel family protein